MDTRRIGSLEVSVIGLGTNNFGFFMEEDAVAPVVDAALEAGITFFDTADSYLESEPRLARALGGRRDDVVLGTKFASPVDGGPGGAAPDYVRTAVERSLHRLGTDRIDLYQLHRPDPETPIADTLGVLSTSWCPRGRCARSGARTSVLRSCARPRPPPATPTSCPCRTSGVSWTGRTSRRRCPSASARGSATCPTTRWPADSSRASTPVARTRPPEPGSSTSARVGAGC